tara:strand:- start:201438 stop:202208 length:771 start_codon:yes stop_codon:yes gene_type:complete
MKQNLILVIGLLGSASILAQEPQTDDNLITDRPDATESSSLIKKGALQVESGAGYEAYDYDVLDEKIYTLNTTLLRYGLLENLEIRAGLNYEQVKSSNAKKAEGFSPLLLGAKIGIAEENGLLPKMAILSHLYLPFTANSDFKPETTGIDLRFAFAHTLSEKSALGYNLGAEWVDDSGSAAYIYTLSYGYSLTDNLALYAEIYGDFPENNTANHSWDAGITYLINNNFQLDATVGSGFNTHQSILLSTGFSYRITH